MAAKGASMVAAKKKKWIQSADLDKGSFSAKAKKAGMGTQSFAAKNAGSPGKLGKQSRLAETLSKLRGKGATK